MMKQFLLFVSLAFSVVAQTLPSDAAGCQDSKWLKKLPGCRIDNCEKKDGDRREVTVKDVGEGKQETSTVDGDSRSLMYECATSTSPKSVVEQAAAALRSAGFEVPYVFSDDEGALTAHKGDAWITIEAASHFYTLIETNVTAPDYETLRDAASMAEALEKYNHIPLYGIKFVTGSATLAQEAAVVLFELGQMMDDNPEWVIRVEGYTDNLGTHEANMTLSLRRANAVVSYLSARGIKGNRVKVAAMAEANPIAPNDLEDNRAKNRRIEIVLVPPAQ
jgi:outer membrane protein OmpA-like peptidoglycan-associated protein